MRARPVSLASASVLTSLYINVPKVNHLKLFRYLHLIIGLAALIVGLVNALPFFSQQGPIDLTAILLLLAGLINLQQFNQTAEPTTQARRAVGYLAGVLIILSALIPLLILAMPAAGPLGTYAVGAATTGVCLVTLTGLTAQLSQLNLSLPGKRSDREAGTVKWFNTNKGFGFISRDQGDDVFVHFRAIRGEGHRALTEGQRVEFVVARRDKGLQAEDVVIL